MLCKSVFQFLIMFHGNFKDGATGVSFHYKESCVLFSMSAAKYCIIICIINLENPMFKGNIPYRKGRFF